MFDALSSTYTNIISAITIIGYKEEDIIKRGNNLKEKLNINTLFILPKNIENPMNKLTIDMIFPDNNYIIEYPKFFSLTLTNQYGTHTYLYNLKFPEIFLLKSGEKINVPLVISIFSNKEDLEPFKTLLFCIHEIITSQKLNTENDYPFEKIFNYKKVELLNLFEFCFSLIKPSAHTLIRMKIENNELFDNFDIDYYYNSNCEIPCNKNDTDINILFLLLDQTIIVKILFYILLEKQIILRASQAYILHTICPSFLKLLFPFKYIHSFVPVLPYENLELLDKPGPFLFGVLSSQISVKEIQEEYPGKIIVDIDSNEIFENNLEDYVFDKENNEGFVEGKNVIYIENNYFYKYESEKNKKVKMNLKEKNYIIINPKENNFLIDKSIKILKSDEWQNIRKNIQLIKNPEIFELDKISRNKNKENYNKNILLNRSFSYNIQNIFLNLYLEKMKYENSDFMQNFKQTNLYDLYLDSKKYQNDSGKKIVENIFNKNIVQRNFYNCFEINYNFKSFPAKKIIDDLNSFLDLIKEKNLSNEEENKMKFKHKKLNKILHDYCSIKGIYTEEDNLIENFNNKFENKENKEKINRLTLGNINNNYNYHVISSSHIKNNTSVLQMTNVITNYVLNSQEGENQFLFYSEKGFFKFYENLNFFIENFNKFNVFNYDLDDVIFNHIIFDQITEILEKIPDCFNIEQENEKKNNENLNNNNNKQNKNVIKNNNENKITKNNEIIKETNSENESENNSLNIKEEEGELNLNIDNENLNILKFNNLKEIAEEIQTTDFLFENDKNKVIFRDSEENKLSTKTNENLLQINHYLQYYLFIAKYLEIIKNKPNSLKILLDNLKDYFELKNEIDINLIIFKLYKKAFDIKDKLDFSYIQYKNFLDNLNYEEIEKINFFEKNNEELKEIFQPIFENKKKNYNKLKISLINNNNSHYSNSINQSTNISMKNPFQNEENNNNNNKITINTTIDVNRAESMKTLKKNEIESSQIYGFLNIESVKDVKTSLFGFFKKENEKEYYSSKIIINESINNNELTSVTKNTITEICSLISCLFPSSDFVKSNNIHQILNDTSNKLTSVNSITILINSLKKFKPESITKYKERLCFWLNCFNYLILYTIFYKKWVVNCEKDWKKFLKNVYFRIGKKKFNFNDMQYIIFRKVLFFNGSVHKDELEPFSLKSCEDYEEEKIKVSYFSIYLPTKEFFEPRIFEPDFIEEEMQRRTTNYFNNNIKLENKNILEISDFIFMCEPKFEKKSTIEKYKNYLPDDIYKMIYNKKFKDIEKRPIFFELDFLNLLPS